VNGRPDYYRSDVSRTEGWNDAEYFLTDACGRDRDHDGLLDARYVARFKRPSTHGHYKLRTRFAGSATLRRSHRGMNLMI
jgi:hypothetical protein